MTDTPATIRKAEAHTSDAALRRLYHEAVELLHELEAAAGSADGMALAGKFVSVMTAHIGPLRKAISDVAFFDEAERVFNLRVVGSLNGVSGERR